MHQSLLPKCKWPIFGWNSLKSKKFGKIVQNSVNFLCLSYLFRGSPFCWLDVGVFFVEFLATTSHIRCGQFYQSVASKYKNNTTLLPVIGCIRWFSACIRYRTFWTGFLLLCRSEILCSVHLRLTDFLCSNWLKLIIQFRVVWIFNNKKCHQGFFVIFTHVICFYKPQAVLWPCIWIWVFMF